jgi:hypothetical protein
MLTVSKLVNNPPVTVRVSVSPSITLVRVMSVALA